MHRPTLDPSPGWRVRWYNAELVVGTFVLRSCGVCDRTFLETKIYHAFPGETWFCKMGEEKIWRTERGVPGKWSWCCIGNHSIGKILNRSNDLNFGFRCRWKQYLSFAFWGCGFPGRQLMCVSKIFEWDKRFLKHTEINLSISEGMQMPMGMPKGDSVASQW